MLRRAARTALRVSVWADVPLQQLSRPTVDRQLGLKLAHPLARRHKLGVVRSRHAGLDAGVDTRLAVPRLDRLIADLKLSRDLRDRPARLNQIDHTPPELRRITPRCHEASSKLVTAESSNGPARNTRCTIPPVDLG